MRARVRAPGTKVSAVVAAYTSTKNVAIGCLLIHDFSEHPRRGRLQLLSHDRLLPFNKAAMRLHHPIRRHGQLSEPGRTRRLIMRGWRPTRRFIMRGWRPTRRSIMRGWVGLSRWDPSRGPTRSVSGEPGWLHSSAALRRTPHARPPMTVPWPRAGSGWDHLLPCSRPSA